MSEEQGSPGWDGLQAQLDPGAQGLALGLIPFRAGSSACSPHCDSFLCVTSPQVCPLLAQPLQEKPPLIPHHKRVRILGNTESLRGALCPPQGLVQAPRGAASRAGHEGGVPHSLLAPLSHRAQKHIASVTYFFTVF